MFEWHFFPPCPGTPPSILPHQPRAPIYTAPPLHCPCMIWHCRLGYPPPPHQIFSKLFTSSHSPSDPGFLIFGFTGPYLSGNGPPPEAPPLAE